MRKKGRAVIPCKTQEGIGGGVGEERVGVFVSHGPQPETLLESVT
jgi:hypothetical protein